MTSMTRRWFSPCAAAAAFSAAALVFAAPPGTARGAPVLPDFSAATFSDPADIDNPYFPLVPNTRYHFSGVEFDTDDPAAEPEPVVLTITVTNRTKVIDGVATREVRELEFVGGLLVEDTTDYFAQDDDGNVWYFEEATVDIEYDDDGNETGRDPGGSWRHGLNGAQATHIMPAAVTVGDNFYSEFAPNDGVLDATEVLALGQSVAVPAGSFTDVRKFRIIDIPEPEEFEDKYYAPGVGRVFVEADFGDGGRPINTVSLDRVTVVPLPPAVLPGLALLGATALAAGYRRLRARR